MSAIKSIAAGLLVLWLSVTAGNAGPFSQRAEVKEYKQVFTTYPYSDPDPVPAMSRIYPYFRYDGFTDQSAPREWKVVELSNDYLQLLILPEIGGKIWAAIDKKSGRPFLYFNHVVKFRDVSMRGPWTSGGIEANYGIIGHTPNCFSPVDYITTRNADGSASCVIGTLDLLTRTTWRLEINLPADQACFTTRSVWHNGSVLEEPYYTWMNVGIKAAGNLQFIHPGNRYLGHDGRVFDWPLHPANGHDLSWYEQNNFGPYKSYHVFGRLSEFFGGYYHDEDFGLAHYSDYADKPGRKIWIWGLSRQGMIWEDLLTDTDGQYVEVQSGRLFNQTAEESTLTPFKHKGFPPHATDTWTEYWLPVAGTKGFVSASPWGAMNVTREEGQWAIRISAARHLRERLEILDGTNLLQSFEVALEPMQNFEQHVRLPIEPGALAVSLGNGKLRYESIPDDELSRPVVAPVDFDWQSDYGLCLRGKEKVRQRAYSQAEPDFLAALKANPNYAPALVELAALSNRRADWTNGRDYALKALAVDTYDPGANYHLGLASAALGRHADVRDAFSIAALSPGWRSAAFTELAKEELRVKQYERALARSEAALDGNRRNLDAIQIQACVHRMSGDDAAADSACRTMLQQDPLCHFARFEQYLRGRMSPQEFTSQISNELPWETYLELAAWYCNAGLDRDAARVLELAPPAAEVLYWQAYLRQDPSLLEPANAASPAFVFPFRIESIPVFDWAIRKSGAWQPRYYLALIRWHQGELVAARELLSACGNQPQFGPFYAARAQVNEAAAVADLERAVQMDPDQWRYGLMLGKRYLARTNASAALVVTEQFTRRFPGNNVLSLLHARTLVLNRRYKEAADLLASLRLLPCEGSTEARMTMREACLMLALQQMGKASFDEAQQLIARAREWPENLGAGKPYPEDLDERLENWLAFQCFQGRDAQAAQALLDKILAYSAQAKTVSAGSVINALALKESGRASKAVDYLASLQSESPDDKRLVAWAKAVVTGNTEPEMLSLRDSESRILAAWFELAGQPRSSTSPNHRQ